MLLASDTRHEFAGLFDLYVWVMIVTAAIVFGAVVFAAVRYRRGRGHAPSSRTEANTVEVVYAVILAAVIALLVTRTFTTENRVDAVASSGKLEVGITAFKWGWRFDYPASGVSAGGGPRKPPSLHRPGREPRLFSPRSPDLV